MPTCVLTVPELQVGSRIGNYWCSTQGRPMAPVITPEAFSKTPEAFSRSSWFGTPYRTYSVNAFSIERKAINDLHPSCERTGE